MGARFGDLLLEGVARKRYARKVRATGPLAYWPMDEQANGVAYDRSGNGRNGAYTGVTFNVPGAERMSNPGFETAGGGGADVFANWDESVGDGTIVDETTLVRGGGHAAKLTSGPTFNTRVIHAAGSLAVLPYVSYEFSFWTRGDGANAGRYLVWDTTNGAVINGVTTTGVPGTTYTRVTVPFTTPAGCVAVSLSLYGPAVNGGIVYFDDVSVVARSPNGNGDGRNAPFFDGVNDVNNVYGASLAAAWNGAEGSAMVWARVVSAPVWADATTRRANYFFADVNNRVFICKITGANTMALYRVGGGTISAQTVTLSDLLWHCYVVTWSQAGNVVRCFLDGAQIGGDLGAIGTWVGALGAGNACVGAGTSAGAEGWSGLAAHAAVWARALTAVEVARLARV